MVVDKKAGHQKPWYVLSTREWLMTGIGLALGTTVIVPFVWQHSGSRGTVIHELVGPDSGVISRTEIGRKEPTTVIEVLDDTTSEDESSKTAADKNSAQTMLKEEDLQHLQTVLQNLDAERTALIDSLKTLSQTTFGESARLEQVIGAVKNMQGTIARQAEEIQQLKSQKGDAFGEKVKDLSLIFLGQQLVVLDNAYTRGDVTVEALRNVENFARDVAVQPAVADHIAALADMAKVGTITRFSLISEIDRIRDEGAPLATVAQPQNPTGSLWERFQARVSQWIKVRKVEKGVSSEGGWADALAAVKSAVLTGQDKRAQTLLAEGTLAEDARLDALRAHVDGYLQQQHLLQTAQNTYYSLYRP